VPRPAPGHFPLSFRKSFLGSVTPPTNSVLFLIEKTVSCFRADNFLTSLPFFGVICDINLWIDGSIRPMVLNAETPADLALTSFRQNDPVLFRALWSA